MSVAASITNALRRFGRPMTLRRETKAGTGTLMIPLDVTVYGTTDGAVINRLIGSIVQTDTHVVFSNAEITEAQWPGPPKSGDKMIIDSLPKTIAAVEPKLIATEILVFICQTTG